MRRLREFDVVSISLPDNVHARSGWFQCHVLAIAHGTAALEAVRPSDTIGLPPRVVGTMLSFRHEGTLVGLRGVLTTREALGDLRFTVEDGVQQPGRQSTRIDVVAPITLRHVASGEQDDGRTVNLSADGILAETRLAGDPGDELEVTLRLPDPEEPVSARATVVRQATGTLAMMLVPEERAARTALARFVLEHNRAILRRASAAVAEFDF